MSPLLLVLVFLASLLALEGVFQLLRSRRDADPDAVRRRLAELASHLQAEPARKDTAVRPEGRRSSWAQAIGNRLSGPVRLDLLLYRAGLSLSPERFVFVSLLMAGLGWAVTTAMTASGLLGTLGLAAGWLPWLVVRRSATTRTNRFGEQLSDGLGLITRALRAGHALGTGFQLVGEEMGDPIGHEFALVAEEVRFGIDLRDALRNLAHRVDNPDLPFFVTAVVIQQQTGGNLAEILDKLGVLLRERSQFHGKVRALTAQGRAAALFLALWLPVVTVALAAVSPQYLAPLLETTWGNMVLLGVGLLDITAYLTARRIASVAV